MAKDLVFRETVRTLLMGHGAEKYLVFVHRAASSTSLSELAHVLHGADINAVLLDDLALVQHVELLRGVLAGEEHDGLLAARVVLEELGHVVDLRSLAAAAVRFRYTLNCSEPLLLFYRSLYTH